MNNIIPSITFKRNVIHTNKPVLKAGVTAPNLDLVDKDLKDRSLGDFPGFSLLYTTKNNLKKKTR